MSRFAFRCQLLISAENDSVIQNTGIGHQNQPFIKVTVMVYLDSQSGDRMLYRSLETRLGFQVWLGLQMRYTYCLVAPLFYIQYSFWILSSNLCGRRGSNILRRSISIWQTEKQETCLCYLALVYYLFHGFFLLEQKMVI